MLAPDLQPFVLLAAALVIFFLSTRPLPIGIRALAWFVGAGLVMAAWFGGPLVPTNFSALTGFLRDQGAHVGAVQRNSGTLSAALNPTLDLFLLAVGASGVMALFGFAPRRDDGEPSERPFMAALFGIVFGAVLAISLAAALGFHPTRQAFVARGEDVSVVDGDTLRIGDVTLRIAGIDAPDFFPPKGEASDPRAQACFGGEGKVSACGEDAMKAVSELVRGGLVLCERVDAASAPVLVRCNVRKSGGAFDLGERIAALGFAAQSEDGAVDYARPIAAAQEARRGFWSACGLTPTAWRNVRVREAFRARKFEEISAGDFVGRDRCPASSTPPPPPEPASPRRRRAS